MIDLRVANQLETILTRKEIPGILFALGQYQFVWEIISSENFLSNFVNYEGSDQIGFWKPSNIGLAYLICDGEITTKEISCENILSIMGSDIRIFFEQHVSEPKKMDGLSDAAKIACGFVDRYNQNPNWTEIFQDIFSKNLYTERQFLDAWQTSLIILYGMVKDFSPIERIIFNHFPFHSTFLALHKILLGNLLDEETASRHLSHIFMELSPAEKLAVVRFLSLRKYRKSVLFYSKLAKSKLEIKTHDNDNPNDGIDLDGETDLHHQLLPYLTEFLETGDGDKFENDKSALEDRFSQPADFPPFSDIYLAEKIAGQDDKENSIILAKKTVESITRIPEEDFFDYAGKSVYQIDIEKPIHSLINLGVYESALELGNYLLKIFPFEQSMYFNLSRISKNLNLDNMQIEMAERGSYCKSTDLSGNRNLAEIYEENHLMHNSLVQRKFIVDSSKYPDLEDLYAYGCCAFQNNNFNLAIEIGLEILEQFPHHGWSCYLVGESYLNLKLENHAIPFLNRSTILLEGEIKPWILLIQAYSSINDQVLRDKTIINAELLFPNEPIIMMERAKYLYENFQEDKGHQVLAFLLKKDNLTDQTTLELGKLFEKYGRLEDALKVYSNLLAGCPENANAVFHIGMINYNLGRFEESIPYLEKYLKNKPEDANIWMYYLQAIEFSYGDCFLLNENLINQSSDLLEKITEACKIILTNNPQNYRCKVVFAECHVAGSRYQEAIDIYEELSTSADSLSEKDVWRVLVGSGIAELAIGDFEKAAARLESAVNLKPSEFIAVKNLAEAYACSGSIENALETGFEYLKQHKNQGLTDWYFEFIRRYANDFIGARYIDRVVKMEPVSFETSLSLANMHIENGLIANAKSVLELVRPGENNTYENSKRIVEVYMRLNDSDSAWRWIKGAHEINETSDIELLAITVSILIHLEAYNDAMRYLERIIAIIPENPALWTLMGDIFAASGDFKAAFVSLEKAAELARTLSNYQDNSSNIIYSFKYLPIDYLKHLSQQNEILRKISLLNREQGKLGTAYQYARQSLDLDPGHLPTINFTVDLAFQLLKFDEAISMASRVKQYSSPERIDQSHENLEEYLRAAINLYCILFDHELSNGNYEEARSLLLGIKSIDPNDPRVKYLTIRLDPGENEKEKLFVPKQEHLTDDLSEDITQSPGRFFENSDLRTGDEMREKYIINAALENSELEFAYNHAKWYVNQYPGSPYCHFILLKTIIYCLEEKTLCEEISFTQNQKFFGNLITKYHGDIGKSIEFLESNPEIDHDKFIPYKRILELIDEPKSIENEEFDVINDVDWLIFLSSIFHKNNNSRELKRLIKRYPGHPRMLIHAALCLYTEDWNEAYKLAHEAVRIVPQNIFAQVCLAFICEFNKRFKEAYESIRIALTYCPEEGLWHKFAARIAMNLDKPNEAIYHLQKSMAVYPENRDLLLDLGMALIKNNQPEDAIKQLSTYQENYPDDYRCYIGLANAHSLNGDYGEALVSINNAIKMAPQKIEPLLVGVKICLDFGNHVLARDYAEKMYALDNQNIDVISTYAMIFEKSGQFEKASQVMGEAINQIDDIPVDFFTHYARILSRLKGPQIALDTLAKKKNIYANQPEFLKVFGQYHLDAGLIQQAELYACEALKIDPQFPGINHLLALIYKTKGFVDMAEKFLKDEIGKNPIYSIDSYIELAEIQKNKSEFLQSLKTYRQAMHVFPNEYRPYYESGLILKEYKDFESAEKMLTRAVELSKDNEKIRRQLAAVAALNLVQKSQEVLLANDL